MLGPGLISRNPECYATFSGNSILLNDCGPLAERVYVEGRNNISKLSPVIEVVAIITIRLD